ncbi:C4-dicarboxylate transporter DcuC [Desulfovibrio sp. OttesenSCG-928-I05]|nr:C4-dicarboxylate transporter DcuC [Desulfovibrio sp. OttesenSCG-928-I05]
METMLLWAGIAIVGVAVYFLVKGAETRLVLLTAGFAMAIISMKPMLAFKAFSDRMVYGGLIEPILSVMGFAYVMKLTKCDAHLIHLLAGGLSKAKWLLVPGAGIVTAIINVPLTSAAGVSAAVGAILIPLLISAGVRPALAAAAVFTGTFGSMLSPGNTHNVFIAEKLLGGVPVMDVIAVEFWPTVIAVLIGAFTVTAIGIIFKENKGFVSDEYGVAKIEKSNLLFAIIPLLPIVILVVVAMMNQSYPGKAYPDGTAYEGWLVGVKSIRISHSMLIGAFLGMLVTRTSPTKTVDQFFRGTGDVYASVMGIIIAAAVFVGGLNACGVVAAFNDMLRNAGDLAKYAATWGPMILAIVVGSGDAATLAFNEAVSPHAADFGMSVMNMGSLANLAGALGRTASPLAGGIIVCAGIAKVSTMEIAKRTAPGMFIASVVALIWFAYIA